MQYQALTTEIYHTLLSEFDDNKSKVIIDALTKIFEAIELKSRAEIIDKKESLKAELYNELRNELATKDFTEKKIYEVKSEISEVRAEISEVRAEISKFKSEVNTKFSEIRVEISNVEHRLETRIIKLEERFDKMEFMMKTLIGLTIFGLTLANPNFMSLMEKIFG